jgi:hypothetical protein
MPASHAVFLISRKVCEEGKMRGLDRRYLEAAVDEFCARRHLPGPKADLSDPAVAELHEQLIRAWRQYHVACRGKFVAQNTREPDERARVDLAWDRLEACLGRLSTYVYANGYRSDSQYRWYRAQ